METSNSNKVDPILEAAGGVGPFQVVQWFLTTLATFSAAFQLLNFIFIGRNVAHVCKAPLNTTSIFEYLQDNSLYINNSLISYEKCSINVRGNVSGELHEDSIPCLFGYQYAEAKETSLISDMDIVCDNAPLKGLGQTLLIIGQGIGAMSLPVLSDRYGRRPVLLISHLCFLGLGIGVAFAPNFITFLVLRVILGIVQQGIVLTKTTISIEMFPTRHRKKSGLMGSILWSVTTGLIGLIAYLMQRYSWRTTQLVYCSVSLYVFVQIVFVEESLSWLITNKKTEQVSKFLKKATRWNKKDYDTAMNLYRSLHLDKEKSGKALLEVKGKRKIKDETKPSFLDLQAVVMS